ncbi:MAG TPA: plastocyanin/azurin family copper-binding protein [Halalkalibaculum sp.]|nr:plastocyanin/azurin family copper-binding protein [Halalkalibaculum sp.]
MMLNNTHKFSFFSLLVLSLILLGTAGTEEIPEDEGKPAATVEMTNTMKFTPDTVRINTGETVLWKNTSLLAHSVTGDPSVSSIQGSAKLPKSAEAFDSGMMDPKENFRHTFKVPGTYQYFCIPHEGAKMYGWVIVE